MPAVPAVPEPNGERSEPELGPRFAHANRVTSSGDDAELVRRFRAGDARAFDALVERYARVVGAVAYAIVGDAHAAADVAQEAFIKAYGGLDRLEDPAAFVGWIRNVTRTTAVDWLRKERKGTVSLDQAEEPAELAVAPSEREPAREAERREMREAVLQEVRDLPESYREVVALKYIEGLSYQRIAAVTGLTEETIESRLFRARNLLKKKLVAFKA